MRHDARDRVRTAVKYVGLLLAAGLTLGGVVVGLGVNQGAAKGKPPRSPVDGGVIYYFSEGHPLGDYWAMAPDGSDKRLVLEDVLIEAEPSELLHGGERWFLTFVEVTGEFYPDGRPRYELAARSEGGEWVQLSDDPSLQLFHNYSTVDALERAAPRWSLSDTRVSYVARRWGVDSSGAPMVVDGGIYAIDLDADIADGPNLAAPSEILVGLPLTTGEVSPSNVGPYPDILGYDWSPDGTWIVYSASQAGALNIVDLLAGTIETIVDRLDVGSLIFPRWSSQDEIVFGWSEIYKIGPDGTGLDLLAVSEAGTSAKCCNGTGRRRGLWSPAGINVMFTEYRYHPTTGIIPRWVDVVRITADGTEPVNLTEDLEEGVWRWAIGWRAE